MAADALRERLSERVDAAIRERAVAADEVATFAESLNVAASTMAQRFQGGARMYVIGTDEVRTDVTHVTVEFLHPVVAGARAISTMSIPSDERLRSRVRSVARPGDVCLALGRRGENLARAALRDPSLDVCLVSLVDRDVSTPARPDVCVVVPGSGADTMAKEALVSAYHLLWELVHAYLGSERVPA